MIQWQIGLFQPQKPFLKVRNSIQTIQFYVIVSHTLIFCHYIVFTHRL